VFTRIIKDCSETYDAESMEIILMVHIIWRYYFSEYDCILVFSYVSCPNGLQESIVGVVIMLWA
jgi:hypothetical protein